MLLQKIWAKKFDWDDTVTADNEKEFSELTSTVLVLELFSIQRPYNLNGKVIERTLIGFCDASERTYCAVLYLKLLCDDGSLIIYLISLKTKVLPVSKPKRIAKDEESLTIHRLELMAAALLTELIQRIARNLNLALKNVSVFWTRK